MKRIEWIAVLALGLIFCGTAGAWSAAPPAAGGKLPDFPLAAPRESAE